MNWPWLLVLTVGLAAVTSFGRARGVSTDSKPVPKVFGDKIPKSVLITSNSNVQKRITSYHNFFRSRVDPPAANMLAVKWHEGAAKAAQKWAETCKGLTHDNATGLHTDAYGQCGQNIFISTEKVPWFFAIKTWFAEKKIFTFGAPPKEGDLHKIGHYTQMVWATSHQLGCGWAECDGTHGPRGFPYFTYICNYCPGGNKEGGLTEPYELGESCSSCSQFCRFGKLCTNYCSWADIWSNCKDLQSALPDWLCHTNTEVGRERRQFCRATCDCKKKII